MDFGGPVETFQGAFFLKASILQPIRQVFVIAALHFVGKHQLQKLRIIEFFLASIGLAVGQSSQDTGESQAFQYRLQFSRSSGWEPNIVLEQSVHGDPDVLCIAPKSADRSVRPAAEATGTSPPLRIPPGARAGWFRGCGGRRLRDTTPKRDALRRRDR